MNYQDDTTMQPDHQPGGYTAQQDDDDDADTNGNGEDNQRDIDIDDTPLRY